MLKNYEEVQKVGQQNAETTTKLFGTISNGTGSATRSPTSL